MNECERQGERENNGNKLEARNLVFGPMDNHMFDSNLSNVFTLNRTTFPTMADSVSYVLRLAI